MRTLKKQKSILCAVAVSALLSQSLAITYAAEQEEFIFDQVVVTANRIPQTVSSTPADVTVVTAEQIEEKGARNLADALEGVPGVIIAKRGGSGEIAVPYLLGTDRIVVLIDGKRINQPQGIGSGNGGIDLSTIMIADNIERIEIVRGGGSVLYGADAVGGVINVITKQGTGGTKTTVDFGGGSDATHHFAISNQGAENGWHWYVTGVEDNTDGQLQNSDYKGKNATVRIDRDLSENEVLSINYDYYDSHAGFPGSIKYPTTTDYGDVLRHNFGTTYTNKYKKGDSTLKYYGYDQTNSGYAWGSSFRHKNDVQGIEYQENSKVSEKHLFTWGGEWRKEKITSTSEVAGQHNRNVKAVYIQDKYDINKDFTMTTGLRYDDNSQYGDHWLPKVAFNYKTDTKTSYFASWGKVARAPKFDDLYGDDGYGNTGNPNLKAETGWTAEIGVKKQVSVSSEGTISFFKHSLNDAIKWQNEDITNTWRPMHPQNLKHLTTQGVSATFATKISPVLSGDIGYTYLDSRDETNKQQAPYNTFNIGIKLQQGKFTQNVYGRYVEKNNNVASYSVWDTTLRYAMSKEQSLYFNVTNLFNKKYQAVNGYLARERSIFFGLKQSI